MKKITASDFLAGSRGHVHGVGVCGVGMAGVAALLRGRGFTVSGCDVAPNRLAEWLKAQGVAVAAGHDPAHLDATVSAVIRSAAAPDDLPELQRARAMSLPVFSRGAMLAALLSGPGSVAVCGTHGKTTTSSLLTQILMRAGKAPSWCIGGETVLNDGVLGVSHLGDGEPFVAEADESDGTLALYAPDTTVITNVEFDHMEHFAGPAEFEACFRTVAARTARHVLYALEDPGARRLCAGLAHARSFGFAPEADIRAERLVGDGIGQRFSLCVDGTPVTEVFLPFPGRHNVLNALGAAAAALTLGVTPAEIAAALADAGLPRRRFQKLTDRPDLTVVSDYAHHPSEIAALIGMVPGRRRIVVYQPHRYTRTRLLAADFAAAFDGADTVILLPVYAASEAPIPGGAHWDLYARMRSDAEQAGLTYRLRLAMNFNQVRQALPSMLKPGDCLMIAGAGDVERLAEWAADRFGEPAAVSGVDAVPRDLASREREIGVDSHAFPPQSQTPAAQGGRGPSQNANRWFDGLSPASSVRMNETLAGKTTLKAGGRADVWVTVGSESDLRALVALAEREQLALRMLGGGSNVLASDFGVDGIVARLSGRAFGSIRKEVSESGGSLVVCGAAAPLARLLDFTEKQGLIGLEFLEGIPGTVGGALVMSAGVPGEEIGDRVAWVRTMDRSGRMRRWSADALDFSYRRCAALRETVVLEAAFLLEPGRSDAVRARRRTLARARSWMRGLRSAGSVFKNPPGDKAGRLLEESGMKGCRVGAATLRNEHANIAVLERGACASDLLALLALARDAAQARFGVTLEPEIDIWERP